MVKNKYEETEIRDVVQKYDMYMYSKDWQNIAKELAEEIQTRVKEEILPIEQLNLYGTKNKGAMHYSSEYVKLHNQKI